MADDRKSKLAKLFSANLENGKLQFGFVKSTDAGLSPEEYIRYPEAYRMEYTAEDMTTFWTEQHTDVYLAVLCSDAETVASFDVPDSLKPVVAASRAFAFAAGWVTEESTATACI